MTVIDIHTHMLTEDYLAFLDAHGGPNDAGWAADPAWQAFSDALISAGRDARDAAVNKDVEAMYTAGEVLYPPCEECHLQFHPGVKAQ